MSIALHSQTTVLRPIAVFVTPPTSWLTQSESEKRIFRWIKEYHLQCQLVMVADIHPDKNLWLEGKELEAFRLRLNDSQLLVFRRKSLRCKGQSSDDPDLLFLRR